MKKKNGKKVVIKGKGTKGTKGTKETKETKAGELRKLIEAGKNDEEIMKVFLPQYLEKGKTETYGRMRMRYKIRVERAKKKK